MVINIFTIILTANVFLGPLSSESVLATQGNHRHSLDLESHMERRLDFKFPGFSGCFFNVMSYLTRISSVLYLGPKKV